VLFAVIMLAFSLGLILLASVLFTNGVELLGARMNMHQGAIGSILAAVGTALPETVIPIIAILIFRDEKAKEVGIGAIAGAPFMLATLGFFVTGLAVLVYGLLGKRPRVLNIHPPVVIRDLSFFVGIYGVAVLTTFVHDYPGVKIAVAVMLLLAYVWYVRKTITSEGTAAEGFEPLFFSRLMRLKDHTALVVFQVVAALGLMVWAAHMFVGYTEQVSSALGVSALVLSIIITPIATELPEKCNSIIWIGKKKDVLALGNITGAMVFQSSFPVVFGVLFTHWDLLANGGITMVSAVLAFFSALLVLVWVLVRKNLNPYVLMFGGLVYAAFVIYVKCR
jgi:cation:H+ antiporter